MREAWERQKMKIDTDIELKDVERIAQAIEKDARQPLDGFDALTEGAEGEFSDANHAWANWLNKHVLN